MSIDWGMVTGIVTAVSTGTLALIGVVRLIYLGIRHVIRAKATARMNRCPLERIEVINVNRYSGKIMSILVRNRSQVPVGLRNPVFEICGSQSQLPGSMIQDVALAPGQTKSFMMEFIMDVSDNSLSKCVLVDTGRKDQG